MGKDKGSRKLTLCLDILTESRIFFCLLLLHLLLTNTSTICCQAFQLSPSSRTSFLSIRGVSNKSQQQTRAHSSLVTAVQAKKKKSAAGNKRKPRFAQQAYKTNEPKHNGNNADNGEAVKRALSPPPSEPRSSSPSTPSSSSSYANRDVSQPERSSGNYNRRPAYISPNVPWNSGKSVEDLESIMTRRWGTDSSQWSENNDNHDDEDYEIVYDDDDDDKSSSNNNNKDGKNSNKKNKKSAARSALKDEFDTAESSDNFFFRPSSSPPSSDSKKQSQRDFYDPDDVGYESPSSQPRTTNNGATTDLNFDNIVSPRPVGGRGTNDARRSSNNEDAADSERGGFFFRKQQQRASGPSAESRQQMQPAKPEREKHPKDPALPFVTDENGNPLLLTCKQAQKNFNAAVAQDGMLNVDNDTDENNDPTLTGSSWEALGITSPALLRNLQRMECSTPLAVQDKSCPSIITGNDVLVGTYTGSGKTLAFLVPLIERVLVSDQHEESQQPQQQSLRILVVVPGRELASQVVSVARQLLEGTGMSALLAIGGTGFSRNLEDIRKKKPSIIVGTPGRVAELVVGKPGERRGRLQVPNLQSLVLDEFDALLEYKPHREPTAAIVSALKQRHRDALQSILCSATATDMLGSAKLSSYLRPGFAQAMADRDDVLVTAQAGGSDSQKGVTRVSRTVIHGVVNVQHRRFALDTLRRILHTDPIPQQILIFAENARKVTIVVEKLEAMGIVAAALSGGAKSEKMDRAEVAKALREGYVGIVVATELAARGLDAPLLTHVINLDLPTDASHYAHRAGRVGRGGRPGVVINLTTSPQERAVPQKFADRLGVTMHTVEARAGKLHLVEDAPKQG